MTIKSETKIEKQKCCQRTKQWCKKQTEDIGSLLIIGLLGIVLSLQPSSTSSTEKELAKDLVRNDYPTVMCLSANGQFRIYDAGSYSVHKHKDNGWNIYWTKKGSNDASSFHLGRCEVK